MGPLASLLAAAALAPALAPVSGPAGCLSLDGTEQPGGPAGACTQAAAIGFPGQPVFSPDGRFAYIPGQGVEGDSSGPAPGGGLGIFARDTSTGTLRPIGCLNATGGGCTLARGLPTVSGVALSPDGRSLYLLGRTATLFDGGATFGPGTIYVYRRDAATGALMPLTGRARCLNSDGRDSGGRCTRVPVVDVPVFDPGGRSAYVGSFGGGLAALSRNRTTGALKPLHGRAACLSRTGSLPGKWKCGHAPLIGHVQSVAVSSDGGAVWVSAFPSLLSDPGGVALTALTRHGDGSLTPVAGRRGCLLDSKTPAKVRRANRQCPRRAGLLNAALTALPGRKLFLAGPRLAIASTVRGGGLGSVKAEGSVPNAYNVTPIRGGRAVAIVGGFAATDQAYGFVLIAATTPGSNASLGAPDGPRCAAEVAGVLDDPEYLASPQSPPCAAGRALLDAYGAWPSPDGRSLYVIGGGDSFVAGTVSAFTLAP